MEGRKTYIIEFTKGELETIIWGLDAYQAYYSDKSFETLRLELEDKLRREHIGE